MFIAFVRHKDVDKSAASAILQQITADIEDSLDVSTDLPLFFLPWTALLATIGKQLWMLVLVNCQFLYPSGFMNQLKSIYNSPFKDSHSHPIHTCFPIIF